MDLEPAQPWPVVHPERNTADPTGAGVFLAVAVAVAVAPRAGPSGGRSVVRGPEGAEVALWESHRRPVRGRTQQT